MILKIKQPPNEKKKDVKGANMSFKYLRNNDFQIINVSHARFGKIEGYVIRRQGGWITVKLLDEVKGRTVRWEKGETLRFRVSKINKVLKNIR